MRTILVAISEDDFEQFGLQSEDFTFPELLEIVNCELSKQKLEESQRIAEKFGLSESYHQKKAPDRNAEN